MRMVNPSFPRLSTVLGTLAVIFLVSGCMQEEGYEDNIETVSFQNDDVLIHLIEDALDPDEDVDLDNSTFLVVNLAQDCDVEFDYELLGEIHDDFMDDDLMIFLFPCEEDVVEEGILLPDNTTYEPEYHVLNNPLSRAIEYESFFQFLIATAPTHVLSPRYGWNSGIILVDDGNIIARYEDSIDYDAIIDDLTDIMG